MADFLLLMHGDTTAPEDGAAWESYFGFLQRSGAFEGGSSFGDVRRYRRTGEPAAAVRLTGYLRVCAADWAGAEVFLEGNPVLASGGTVEILELVRD